MKYLSFVVPSYNSEAYLNKCIDSLLKGGEDVEIIIVNDGSKDRTKEIAEDYMAKNPSIVKVINKENGGHGSGVNYGLKNATGVYFKVVDSDDWVDEDAYKKFLTTIKENYGKQILPDLYFTNFVFEHVEDHTSAVQSYKSKFPVNRLFTWKEAKRFNQAEFLMMHALTYKTQIIRDSQMVLPEHTFYVDNIFTYQPLAYVKSMYYLDLNFYRYFIGRSDQSVNYKNMVKRYDQQLRVISILTNLYTLDQLKSLSRKHYKYMIHDLVIKEFLTLFFVTADGNKEKEKAYKDYWSNFKKSNSKLYRKIRYRTYFVFPSFLIKPVKKLAVMSGYKLVCKAKRWG